MWRFAKSDAFIRGLMGPWRCLSGDTEFLTPTGWKRIDNYQPGDLVAQWDHRDGTTTFVPPMAYIKQPSEGFLRFDCGGLIMEITPNHRVPHYDWSGKFRVREAGELAARPSRCKIPVTFTPNDRPGLPMSDDLIRFAVMMHADGHYPKHGRKAVVCVRKDRKKVRIRATLSRLGLQWKESVYPKRPTETTFSFEPPYRGKRFTGDWWKATPQQLAVVFDEMRYWDGHISADKLLFTSAYREDADFIQYTSHVCGHRADIHMMARQKKHHKDCFNVSVRRGAKNGATIRDDSTRVTEIPAKDGLQYCFSVPTGFFVARCRGTVFVTGNSGKSSGCVVEIMRRAQEQRPSADGIRRTRWMIVRNTRHDLEDTTIKTFMRWVPEKHFGVFNKSTLSYKITGIPGCEIEVWFRALDNEDDIKHLLSLEVTGVWVNEAREIPWSIIKALQGRVRQYPSQAEGGCTWGGIILDTNPPDTTSEWYKFFEEKKHPPSYAEIFKQPSGLSPEAENIAFINDGRKYYERLCHDADEEWIKVYVAGEYGFIKEGRAVYTTYSDAQHLREMNPLPGIPVHRGWDWGLTPACILSQQLPDQRWLTFDEITSDDMSVDLFFDIVDDHCKMKFKKKVEFIDTGDPAGNIRSQIDKRTCFAIGQAKGFNVQPGLQSLTVRLESVRKPLRNLLPGGHPQFILHPRCVLLRKGFLGGYHLRRLRVTGERYADVPEKNAFSHPHDALQYTATQIFGTSVLTGKTSEDFEREQAINAYEDQTRSQQTGY